MVGKGLVTLKNSWNLPLKLQRQREILSHWSAVRNWLGYLGSFQKKISRKKLDKVAD